MGRAKESEEQMKLYQQLLDQLQKVLTVQERQGNIDSATYEGLEHLRAGRVEPARAALEKVLTEAPEHPLANLGMSTLLLSEGQAARARDTLKRFLEVSARGNAFIRAAVQFGKSGPDRSEGGSPDRKEAPAPGAKR